MGACEYLTVILCDNSSEKTLEAVEIAKEASKRGAKEKNAYSRVETILFQNLDSDVSWDNYLWSMILRADSLLFITSFNSRLSKHVLSFLRKTTGRFIYNARVSFLIVNYDSDCTECSRNHGARHSANSIFRKWATRNQLYFAMDASINVSGSLFHHEDLNYWKDVSFIMGENLVN